MNTKMQRYYQKKKYGGRSIVARIFDFVMFRFFLLLILFFMLLYFSRSFKVSLLISLFLTIAASLIMLIINRKKIERFIAKDLKRIKEKCLLETLTFMPENEYIDYISKLFDGLNEVKAWDNGFLAQKNNRNIYVFHNHPRTDIDVSDILNVLRKSEEPIAFVSLSNFNENARALCQSMDFEVTMIPGKRVLELATQKKMLPDEEVAEERAENEMNASLITFEKIKQLALNKTKVRRYIICGVIVLLWSIVTGFKFYYPIIAAVCFILAVLAFRKGQTHDKESSGIDLS